MKHIIILLFLVLIFTGCGGPQKSAIAPDHSKQTAKTSVTEMSPEKAVEQQIIEIEEKLVPVNNLPPDPARYFVIIGSFRIPENATNYQKEIEKDGFLSDLLKNEAGLYRVSVMATDDILKARNEIKRIRTNYPKYYDA